MERGKSWESERVLYISNSKVRKLEEKIINLEKQIEQAKSNKVLDIAFLFASPLLYKDKEWKTVNQLDFVNE